MIKTIFVLTCFVLASYTDTKKREVPNILWLFMLPFGVLSLWFALSHTNYLQILSAFLIPSLFGLVCWCLGGIGGADAKAIIVLSMFYPYWLFNIPFVVCILGFSGLFMCAFLLGKRDFNSKNKYPMLPFLTLGIACIWVFTEVGVL